MAPTLIVICGPTAVGKTRFAIQLAQKLSAEIISADARQFFKEMSIGTAKPSADELAAVKHHFVDNKSIEEVYNASQFEEEVLDFLSDYFKHKTYALMIGGSGMYINAVCHGFDQEVPDADEKLRLKLNACYAKGGLPQLLQWLKQLDSEAHEQIDTANSKRVMRAIEICELTGKALKEIRQGQKKKRPFKIIKIGLELPRQKLYDRINQRVDIMHEQGLLGEVRSLEKHKDLNALKTVGYTELFKYLSREWTLDFALEKIKINTRRYAKRQMTWFKKDEEILWHSPHQLFEVLTYIRNDEQS